MENSISLHTRIFLILVIVPAVLGRAQITGSMSSPASHTSKIAFVVGNATKRFDIFQINPDGSGLLPLTHDHRIFMKWNRYPAWSPDGKQLAFVSSDLPMYAKSHDAVFILDVARDSVRELFRDDARCLLDPAWSPDAEHVVFARGVKKRVTVGHYRTETCTGSELYSVNLDGYGLRQLTHNETTSARRPAWSPDGGAIAYVSRPQSKEEVKADIFLIDADGSNPRQLTQGGPTEVNADPSWLPDGTTIAFWSNRSGADEIYVIDRDGANVRQLTHGTPGGARHPSCSPDGSQIVFGTGDAKAVFIMNADGTNVRVLAKFGWYPAFGKAVRP